MELGDKSTTFRIVDLAILPQTPVSPNMVKMITMSIVAGFLLGGGLVFGLEVSRGTISSAEDVKTLGYTLLGTIPTIVEPATVAKRRRNDIMVYAASIVYFSLVVSALAYEMLFSFA